MMMMMRIMMMMRLVFKNLTKSKRDIIQGSLPAIDNGIVPDRKITSMPQTITQMLMMEPMRSEHWASPIYWFLVGIVFWLNKSWFLVNKPLLTDAQDLNPMSNTDASVVWACPMYCNDDCWYVLLVVVMYRLNQFSLTNTTAAVEYSELQTIDLCFPSFLPTENKVLGNHLIDFFQTQIATEHHQDHSSLSQIS